MADIDTQFTHSKNFEFYASNKLKYHKLVLLQNVLDFVALGVRYTNIQNQIISNIYIPIAELTTAFFNMNQVVKFIWKKNPETFYFLHLTSLLDLVIPCVYKRLKGVWI